jgi:FkbM family methyltransferase
MRTANTGFDGRQLHLDTDRFGVADIADAARLCEQLLGRNCTAAGPNSSAAVATSVEQRPSDAAPSVEAASTQPRLDGLRMISYAQNAEDVVLERLFHDQPTGFYVDVGANDPVRLSLTKHFSLRGWRGINIEPGQAAFERLRADRVRDVNLNVGVGSAAGELTLFNCPDNDALSTFSREQAEIYRREGNRLIERRVPIRTLGDILQSYAPEQIDFLSIDVEGFETEVLQGVDLARWRPRVMVIEATRPTTTVQSHAAWEDQLRQHSYRCAYFDGLNRFYVRSEDEHLAERIAVPPNVTDRYESHEMQFLRSELAAKQAALMSLHDAAADLQRQLQDKHQALLDVTSQLEAKHEALMEITRQLVEKHEVLHQVLEQQSHDAKKIGELTARLCTSVPRPNAA